MSETIIHHCKILKITDRRMTVRPIDMKSDNCIGCRLGSVCGVSGQEITIDMTDEEAARGLHPGMEVEIRLEGTSEWKAITMMFLLPLAIFLGVLFATIEAGLGGLYVVLCSLAATALYFLILKLLPRQPRWRLK